MSALTLSKTSRATYQERMPEILKAAGITNRLAGPRIEKICLNMGVGRAVADGQILNTVAEHLSLIAAGNQSGDEAYFTPPLTTIDADWEAEMQHAFALILGRSKPAERSFTTPIALHERGSIAAPRPA